MKIVRVNRFQFADLIHGIQSKSRWCIEGFPANHLWLPSEDVLIVRKEDVDVRDFPDSENLTFVSAIHCAYDMRKVEDEADKKVPTVQVDAP